MFIYYGKLLSQVDGLAMGNPVHPTLVDWFLGMTEKKNDLKSKAFVFSIILRTLFGQCFCYFQFIGRSLIVRSFDYSIVLKCA